MTDETEQSGFNLGPEDGTKPYVVLARKYRPESFKDLIGQEAMVTTLRNAFASDRIAQGYMLTGVRGVGKTTTARILARALNYVRPGLPDQPTVELDEYGEHCREIIQSRHPDVLEMDAASNTGIDNIREIIESARYKPLSARYKVFIIDEVHMLSKGAFNALLKTLEEPPAHVKFIFATTEVRKVPVTVLSRCQRFDLRRVDVPVLMQHFGRIAANENATAEDDALRLIARAAEGSVRDGLSILDQAIAMGSGNVTAHEVRAMLGLADRGRIFDVLGLLMKGDTPGALAAFQNLHQDGADAIQVLTELAETVHVTTRLKATGTTDEALPGEDRRRAGELSDSLSIPVLSRVWQMLVKGIEEANRAPNPLAAAEMVLIRIAYTADLPTPDQVIRALGDGRTAAASAGGSPQVAQPAGSGPSGPGASNVMVSATAGSPRTGAHAIAQPQHQPIATSSAERQTESAPKPAGPESFEAVIELAGAQRDAMLKIHLEDHLSLVSFDSGRIEIYPIDGAPKGLAGELGEKLSKWTGNRWIVTVSNKRGATPIGDVKRARKAAELAQIRKAPAVAAILDVFPDAEISDVRPLPPPSETPKS
ncbi:MAG TPA: DNA polymerase III subunit gamma/tau [Hyphomicrobiaceae bacterium]|nr:DNA polymerase III subunit gamma/tau [Hyphomicrobiaceae bacterium]